MGDAERRRLERAGAAGDVASRARALVERQRHGQLDWDRLVLASMLGDPAAQAAVGDHDVPDAGAVASWASANVGRAAVGRLALALARAVATPAALAALPPHERDAVDRNLEALEVAAGADARAAAAAAARVGAWASAAAVGGVPGAVAHLALVATASRRAHLQEDLLARALRLGGEALGELPLRAALADAVVPWLVGE